MGLVPDNDAAATEAALPPTPVKPFSRTANSPHPDQAYSRDAFMLEERDAASSAVGWQ